VIMRVYGELEILPLQKFDQLLSRMPTAGINEEPVNKVRRNPVKRLPSKLTAHLNLNNFLELVDLDHITLSPQLLALPDNSGLVANVLRIKEVAEGNLGQGA